jgi:predicted TIM-barrel enzyme
MFIAVIHLIEVAGVDLCQRTLEQATIALSNGADGIFLIPAQYEISVEATLACYHVVRKQYSEAFIGINFLSQASVSANNIPMCANALWVDDGLGSQDRSDRLLQIREILHGRGWKGKVYGGFMFKGNNQTWPNEERMQEYVQKLPHCLDVAVSSGRCTGIAADMEFFFKVRSYVEQAGLPLGLASGVSADNIHNFLPHTQDFIIGTGIEESATDPKVIEFYQEACLPVPVNVGHLDGEKVARLAAIIHNR